MSNFNKAILVGRLTKDPEIKYTPQGTQLAKFGLAVNRVYSKNKETDFFNIIAWDKLAEVCAQYLKKGKLVLIEGEIQTRRYETQDGQKRSSFEILARNMQMLGGKFDGEQGYEARSSSAQKSSTDIEELNIDDIDIDEFDATDMPF